MPWLHQQKRFKRKGEKCFLWDQPVYCLLLLFSVLFSLQTQFVPLPSITSTTCSHWWHNSQISQACHGTWAPRSLSHFHGTMPTKVAGGSHKPSCCFVQEHRPNQPQKLAITHHSHCSCCSALIQALSLPDTLSAGGLSARALLLHMCFRQLCCHSLLI